MTKHIPTNCLDVVKERLVGARMDSTEEHEYQGLVRRYYETLYDGDEAERIVALNLGGSEALIEEANFLEVDISDLLEEV